MVYSPRVKIAFATCPEQAELCSDDRLALGPLEKLGIAVEPWVWDDPAARPSSMDGVVIRSCWDYHLKPRRFEDWIRGLDAAGARLWNPARTILWNMNKKYLLDLAAKGARIPKTRWLPRGSRPSERELRLGSRQTVVKPAVSLNGADTALFDGGDVRAIGAAARAILPDRDVLLQEFLPQVRSSGEVSLLFFGGEFSHAVRKTARAGEFRVQEAHGGARTPMKAGPALIAQGERIARMAGPSLLYARVDGIEVGGEFILMELELIEPLLFLGLDPGAPARFARALAAAVAMRSHAP